MANNGIKQLTAIVQNLHLRVTRLEALQGLLELPELGITDERIIEIMEQEGVPWDIAKDKLIMDLKLLREGPA